MGPAVAIKGDNSRTLVSDSALRWLWPRGNQTIHWAASKEEVKVKERGVGLGGVDLFAGQRACQRGAHRNS
jgi:hypothetical protein